MRLLSIELENFRNYTKRAFDFTDPRTLIIGENGTGKSTIVDAIAWAISARCRGVNGRGEGQKDLIRFGASDMKVTLNLEGMDPIMRSLGRNGSTSGTMKPAEALGHLGVTEPMFMGALYGRYFFDMDHALAKAMLMELLDVRVAAADLPGIDLPKGAKDAGLGFLEAAYKTAYDKRAVAKKALLSVAVPEVVSRIDLEKLDAQQLTTDQKAAASAYQAWARAEAKDAAEIKRLEDEIGATELRIGNIEQQRGSLKVHRDMLAEHREKLETAKTKLAELEADQPDSESELGAQAAQYRTLIEKIDNHAPDRGCVLDAGIPCNTGAKHFTGKVAELEKTVAKLTKRIGAAKKRGEEIGAARQDVKNEERQVGFHDGKIAELQEDLEDTEARAKTLDDTKRQHAEAVTKRTESAAKMETARADMERLQASMTELTTYRANVAARQQGQAKRAELQAEVDKLEAQVELLGPKGVQAKALQDGLEAFHSIINTALEPFGFELAINVDPWRVYVAHGDAGAQQYAMLSAGEQLWTGLAFQLALAAVSGLNFAALDASEAVVGENRATLTALVMGAPVDQVLVAMAKAKHEPAPEIDGLQVIRIEA